MKRIDTHLRALHGARRVTAVTRAFKRAATVCAASLALTLLPVGCGGDSEPGTSVGNDASANIGDSLAAQPDTAELLDVILGSDSPPSDEDSGARVAVDTSPPPEDSAVDPDDAALADAGTDPEDVAPVDAGAVDATPADATLADTAVADAGTVPDTQQQASCLEPNGTTCTDALDCQEEGKSGVLCVDGECNEQDFTPNDTAMACCQEMYANEVYDAAGCNPWGPPAPPVDRGYRLEEMMA